MSSTRRDARGASSRSRGTLVRRALRDPFVMVERQRARSSKKAPEAQPKAPSPPPNADVAHGK
jgi:hypothetical protein